MSMKVFLFLMIPFLGTTLGAATVFLLKNELKPIVKKMISGFAAGVMVAASVWSLIIPSLESEQALSMGKFSFVPAAIGIAIGMLFILALDRIIPHLHLSSTSPEGPSTKLKKVTMLVLAVVLHNIPEGIAIGVTVFAFMNGSTSMTMAGALSLSIGIAIQNFPEGAIISMPLKSEGGSKGKSFLYGMLSGIVEPIAALLTIAFSYLIIPLLPYLLSFAAGAMIYVVVEELIPEATAGEHSNISTMSFGAGFILMMILDVALG